MRQLIRPRRETVQPRNSVWIVGLFLSLSVTSGFRPNSVIRSALTPGKRRDTLVQNPVGSCNNDCPNYSSPIRLSPLWAVTDPQVLMSQVHDDGGWTDADRKRIEMLYALASVENKLDPANAQAAQKSKRKVTVKKKARQKVPTSTLRAPDNPEKRKSERVQFRGLSTTSYKGTRRREPPKTLPTKKKSSTMRSFGAESNRQRAYREGLRLAEKNTGRKIVETEKTRKKRRKENGEAMYKTSASVPESMVQFADEIHNEDRISRSEEIELGEKTQEAIRLQHLYTTLQKSLDREPTDHEWCAAAGKINMEAIRQTIEDGVEAKNKLVTSNLRLVQSVVNTYIRNGLSTKYNAGDMMQEGIIALIRAAEKFEPDRGWKFSTYAMYWVRASVKRNQLSQSRVVHVPIRLLETHKRLKKIEHELRTTLDRKPTQAELAKAAGMSELQVERCLRAVAQRCHSLDQEMFNSYKPLNDSGRRDTLVEFIDSKSEDGAGRDHSSPMLREDIIETLHRYLEPQQVELLLLRYGLKTLPDSKGKIGGQPTIAELSRALGLSPDKVRGMIKTSLDHLRTSGADEWRSFQRDLL